MLCLVLLHKIKSQLIIPYVKLFYNGKVYYFDVSMDDVLNSTNNDESFVELKHVIKETF